MPRDLTVETALRKPCDQAMDPNAANGISDVCEDMARLAGQVSDALDARALSLHLVDVE